MNLYHTLIFLSLYGFSLGLQKDEKTYFDMFIHAHDLMQPNMYNIRNSLSEYSSIVKAISESSQPDTYLSFPYNGENYNILAENVTINPEISTQTIPSTGNVTLPFTTKQNMETTKTQNGNSTQPNVQPTAEPQKVSPLCQIHATGVRDGINSQQLWALKMLDSVGKPPASLLNGGFVWLGDYQECISTTGNAYSDEITYTFGTEYCMVSVENLIPISTIIPPKTTISIGMCFPNSCSEEDVVVLADAVIKNQTNNLFVATAAVCQEPDRPYDTRAFIVIIVIAFFISLMVAGTAYDIALIQWPKWQQESLQRSTEYDALEANEKVPLITNKKTTTSYEPGLFGKSILAFSIYTNGTKILSTNQQSGSLTCINGIRFISMLWVILGHTYVFVLQDVDNVTTFLPEMLSRETFPVVANAFVSVDTFFVLSGTLLTFLTLKEMTKSKGRVNWGMYYFHRFWRLTPPYMLVMMVYIALFPYTGSGPLWKRDGVEVNYCKNGWFYNLLYVNNFVDEPDQMCFSHSWYLANDMQFFVLSPLIIVPLFFKPILGFLGMLAILTGSWIATGVMATKWNVPMSLFDGGDMTHWAKMYFRSYFRIGPYLVGMLTGYILYKTDLKLKMNKLVNILGWIVAAVVGCAVLYGVYDDLNGNQPSRGIMSLYITVHRTLWGASVAWVIFSCVHGYGGFINTILSWRGFVPLSRLTYCAYLVHPTIMYFYMYTRRRLIHFTDIEIIYEFLGHVGLSYAAAFITSLAFEAPMMGLEKAFFKRKNKD